MKRRQSHAVLCAAGFNIHWLLRMIVVKKVIGFFAFAAVMRFLEN
jgi:hypothetical protein